MGLTPVSDLIKGVVAYLPNVFVAIVIVGIAVRLETEPITDANVDKATSGPDISDEEHEWCCTKKSP